MWQFYRTCTSKMMSIEYDSLLFTYLLPVNWCLSVHILGNKYLEEMYI